MGKLKLAIIGCGTITERAHLPVAASSDRFEVAMLVDKFLPRARQLAKSYDVMTTVDDYQEVIGKVDAAIVALPNYLHAPVTIDLLQHGVHVLVEKPMALRSSDCDKMIRASSNSGAVLAVGLVRRFYWTSQFVKQMVEEGFLGDILRFDFCEGFIFNWPVKGDFMFRKETGGGALNSIGPHTLDLLLWWLGDYDSVEYYDDAMGGVEADCRLHLRLKNGAVGVVELSTIRNLRNTYIIYGERGTLEVGNSFNSLVRLKMKDQDIVFAGQIMRDGAVDRSILDAFHRQLDDFAEAILSHREPFISGREGKRTVELVEACYALRQPLKQPWMVTGIDEVYHAV